MKTYLSQPIHCILGILVFITGCSAGNKTRVDPNPKHMLPVKNYTIRFEKNITTPFTASGTLHLQKEGDYLVMYDSHVTQRRLSCTEYSTGKEKWVVPQQVFAYYWKNGNLIVQYENSIESIDLLTGKPSWKAEDCWIQFIYPEYNELGDQITVIHLGKPYRLDLQKQTFTELGQETKPATYYTVDQGNVRKTTLDVNVEKHVPEERVLLADVIRKTDGPAYTYILVLNDSTRIFTLSIYNEQFKEIKKHTWAIQNNTYRKEVDRYFDGEPEPEKLEASSFLVNGHLVIFENYINYRWSWGRGCNRITVIDPTTQNILYQQWGQAPGKKEPEFYTFNFYNDLILSTNEVMHFQNSPALCRKVNPETGTLGDTLQQRFNLLEEYLPGVLVGFRYDRKQVQGDLYRNQVFITLWDYLHNEYSQTFDFDFKQDYPYEPIVCKDGTILFTYYDEKIEKDIVCCYSIIQTSK